MQEKNIINPFNPICNRSLAAEQATLQAPTRLAPGQDRLVAGLVMLLRAAGKQAKSAPDPSEREKRF